MNNLEQTLDSREVAEMVGKQHNELLKDVRRYIAQLNEGKIPYVDFFKESTYTDGKGQNRPCYNVTKKGCEFISHKLTGIKGTDTLTVSMTWKRPLEREFLRREER